MAEKKQDLNLLSKGTALKRKADEKRPEISVLESETFCSCQQKAKIVQTINDFSFLIVFASLIIGFTVMNIGCS